MIRLVDVEKLFDEFKAECQAEYHKHFYQSGKYGRWTSSQLNTFYQDKLSELRKVLVEGRDGLY